MELMVDYKRLKTTLHSFPETKPLKSRQTEGFMYLYENVFVPLQNCRDYYTKLDVDVSCFSFDDLVAFDVFTEERSENNYYNQGIVLDQIIGKLAPIRKTAVFI